MSNITDLQTKINAYNTAFAEYFKSPDLLATLIKTFTSHNITIEDWNTVVQTVKDNLELTPEIKDILNNVEDCLEELYEYIPDIQNKVTKTSTPNIVYGTDSSGNQINYTIASLSADKVAKRTDGSGTYAYTHNQSGDGHIPIDSQPTRDTIVLRDSLGQIRVQEPIYNYHPASKGYADTKVSKTSDTDVVYATDEQGAQITIPVDSTIVGEGPIARRVDNTGNIYVGNAYAPNHAASKNYVDTSIANALTSTLVYKGNGTVSTLNALDKTTLKTGWFYNVTNAGQLTYNGNTLDVMAGDNVAWVEGAGWDKMTMDLSVYDDKFIAAGFFEVQNYNENTGEITFVYDSDLYDMSYDSTSGVLTIAAN